MDQIALVLVFIAAASRLAADFANGAPDFNVVDFGAVGDGKTDDSPAFLKAWTRSCGSIGDSSILIPSGKTFLLTPTIFRGSCKSSSVHFQILGDIIAPGDVSQWTNCQEEAWLGFSDVENLIIDGAATLNGHGDIWWHRKVKDDTSCSASATLYFHNCNNLQLSGVHLQDSPRNHIGINDCNGVKVSNIKITAPESSPNTDGIDISRSTLVNIQDSYIGTGDDCIAINSGSKFINITNVGCGPGHGISVGSLGKNGPGEVDSVEEVHVQGCNFTGTENGVRIKTFQGGSGYVRNISFQGITLNNSRNPIVIDQYYDVREDSVDIAISGVTYSRFQGTSASAAAITLNCSASVRCTNIVMDHIDIASAHPGEQTHSECINAQGTATQTMPQVACLSS